MLSATFCEACRHLAAAGPSSISKQQLVQKLVQEFPKTFQLMAGISTPVYGQKAPAGAAEAPHHQQPSSNAIVSLGEFKVSVTPCHASWGLLG